MSRLRPPTLAELAVALRDLPDGAARARLEELYWAKAVDTHGTLLAHWYRQEYESVRCRRRRLEEMLGRPALGAFRTERRAA